MLDAAGLPGRPWFRHLIYAPLPSYRAETLPAIREAILGGSTDFARLQARRLSEKLDAAVAVAKKVAAPAAPRAGPTSRRKSLRGATVPASDTEFVGFITDTECGPDHAPMIAKGGMGANDPECTLACVQKGATFGFVDEGRKKFFQLDDQKSPAPLAGRKVRIEGRLEGDTIYVKSVKPGD
jgi:hypothetical protein